MMTELAPLSDKALRLESAMEAVEKSRVQLRNNPLESVLSK